MLSTTKASNKNMHSLARESILNFLSNSLQETLSFSLAINLILGPQFIWQIPFVSSSWLLHYIKLGLFSDPIVPTLLQRGYYVCSHQQSVLVLDLFCQSENRRSDFGRADRRVDRRIDASLNIVKSNKTHDTRRGLPPLEGRLDS